MKAKWAVAAVACLAVPAPANEPPQTYCNPINLDYAFCPIPNFVTQGKHRTTADPTIVLFRGDYYLFSTNQWGYWWSPDMARWHFVSRRFLKPHHKVYDELCAPAAFVMDDALYVIGSTHGKDFPLWKSTDPKANLWTEAVEEFQAGAWDPAFFLDDDGKLYLYYGSSNVYPLYAYEIDRQTLQPKGERHELFGLHPEEHGWERFGEANDNTFLEPFIEGAWMARHKDKYYLQYAAPGTEHAGYADGVYVANHPLGPFVYQRHNPFCYKPGGFTIGSGHGSTFQDPFGNWWHTSTIAIGVKNNFERRIGIWPAGFDADGVMYCNTAFGDYPHYLPRRANADHPGDVGGDREEGDREEGNREEGNRGLTSPARRSPEANRSSETTRSPEANRSSETTRSPEAKRSSETGRSPEAGRSSETGRSPEAERLREAEGEPERGMFTGWMLLNYGKPVRVSSTLGGHVANRAVDEDLRTYWSAAGSGPDEWLESDLGAECTVHAVQLNYADQDASHLGKSDSTYHQYRLLASRDGRNWEVIIDRSNERRDVPHDYVELWPPITTRFVRVENIHVADGKFALSGLRVFGLGQGSKPAPVREFVVLRGDSERRNAWLKWQFADDATGYVIHAGIAPDKLYTSIMVYGRNEYTFRGMNRDDAYYFRIEAFNESGRSELSEIVTVK